MKTIQGIRKGRVERRGSATVVALLALVMLVGLSGVIMMVNHRSHGERKAMVDRTRAFYAASSGVSAGLDSLNRGEDDDLGLKTAPVEYSGGDYWVTFQDNGDDNYTLTSMGRSGLQDEAIEVVAERFTGGVFNTAVFAGNSSGDGSYTLELGGTAGQADEVFGDIYSGGDVDMTGDATVSGLIQALGAVNGGSGDTGIQQPLPNLAAMNYEVTADFDVATMFGSATYLSDGAGGNAWQMPEDSPAHIFRKNPSDRATETGGTTKDDFFLEDPYESVTPDFSEDGSDAYKVTLSGMDDEPGPNGNRKVYYIDGNLWLHNKKTMSLGFDHDESAGLQIAIVVKGNIYFSDNVFYDDEDKDGVVFIAMKDDAVADSGNIYLGDPEFGTLRRMYGFMYAENNFYDINLDEDESSIVELYGNMTAGNQVVIDRDWKESGETKHTKLMVDFDERIASGDLDMPGLPARSGGPNMGYVVLSWRQVAVQ